MYRSFKELEVRIKHPIVAGVLVTVLSTFIIQWFLPSLLIRVFLLATILMVMFGIIFWYLYREITSSSTRPKSTRPFSPLSLVVIFSCFLVGTFAFSLLVISLAPKIIPNSNYTLALEDIDVFRGFDPRNGQPLAPRTSFPAKTKILYLRLKLRNYFNPQGQKVEIETVWISPSGVRYETQPLFLEKSTTPINKIQDFPIEFTKDLPRETGLWRIKIYRNKGLFVSTIFKINSK